MDGFQQSLHPCALDESSLSTGGVKIKAYFRFILFKSVAFLSHCCQQVFVDSDKCFESLLASQGHVFCEVRLDSLLVYAAHWPMTMMTGKNQKGASITETGKHKEYLPYMRPEELTNITCCFHSMI